MSHAFFGIALQPVVNLRTKQIVHYEALLRIAGHSRFGTLHRDMIAAGEREGWIDEIDLSVLLIVIDALRSYPIRMACNLSPFTIEHNAGRIMAILSGASDVTDRLILEITETTPVTGLTEFCNHADGLKACGCKLALDDYGSEKGFISEELVKRLRPHFLKLDREVTDTEFGRNVFLPRALDLAAGLSAEVIAEFIDTEEKAAWVGQCGIRFGQGFYFGEPKLINEVFRTDESGAVANG